mmetsp:Transcript_110503/g.276690  ORF Transcript_110503/g.276690 Transcript_110503/m.276690 type:complete len:134 (+) Transcript_110503:84-485(+)
MGATCCSGAENKDNHTEAKDPPVSVVAGLPGSTKAEEVVQKKVASGQEFNVKVTKRANVRLGVDVDLCDGTALLVDKVSDDGLVSEWNKANPHAQVEKGDKIVSVNGKRGDADTLAQVCKTDDELDLVVQKKV